MGNVDLRVVFPIHTSSQNVTLSPLPSLHPTSSQNGIRYNPGNVTNIKKLSSFFFFQQNQVSQLLTVAKGHLM